jgi:hypothetical protein
MAHDFPELWADIEASLHELTIPIEEIIGSGGGETRGTQRLRRSLADRGWRSTTFTIEKRNNKEPKESISHKMDHVRRSQQGVVALEIEWNNKDPFFDRDLENFKRLRAPSASASSSPEERRCRTACRSWCGASCENGWSRIFRT